ncbi:MAG: 4-phosphopantetheinyl transferase [Acidobacteriota bacterium]|jgi:4'-phosphopantetheinyl transferase|nr:4-phosphopantetheinyl transferase [Acidobacteriota bacterium]
MRIEVAVLPVGAAAIGGLWGVLDAEERARAERYRGEEDRRRSIVARGTVRRLLGERLGRDPRELRFVEGPQGKPALAGRELEFNVSHSGDRVAIAIAEGAPVGIDIEVEQPRMTDLVDLARRYFSRREALAVEQAAAEGAIPLFFTIWTAKEAVIKAVGGGLSIQLASFSVLPVRSEWGAVENLGGDPMLDGWHVAALPSEPGYRAAVAAPGIDWEIVPITVA